MGIQGYMAHAVLTREMISHAKRHHKNLFMVQIDFSNAFGSVPQEMIEYNMLRMGLPPDIVTPVMNIYDGCETAIVTPGGESTPIKWTGGTVQGCPLSPVLFNICLEPFLRAMDRPEYVAEGFPILIEDPDASKNQTLRINTAAYADDLILYSDKEDSINKHLELFAKYCSYTGMKINVKKCVSLCEKWNADKQDRIPNPVYSRQYFGLEPATGEEKWGDKEQIPMQPSSLYLGTTIAFNREDDANHGKHILDSMRENIDQIGFKVEHHAEDACNQDFRTPPN
jgi:hypothetical protein